MSSSSESSSSSVPPSTSSSVISSSSSSVVPPSSPPPSTSATPSSTTVAVTSSTTSSSTTSPTTIRPVVASTPSSTPTSRPSVITSTSFVSVTASKSSSASATAAASNSKGFFQNTGAVAGVFSVVGLIGLAIIIALVTNAIRRRRAKKFDREIAEAAREAANAPAPVFLDDEEDRYGAGRGGYNGAGGVYPLDSGPYSDISSHGTYTQPPMSQDSYGMRELGHGPAPGEFYDYSGAATGAAAAAGAAGIGVARARSMRDGGAYGQALQDGASPYPAFAAPNPAVLPHQQQHPYSMGRFGARSPDAILEAAGIGAPAGGAALGRGQSQYQQQQQQQQQQQYNQAEYANLGRNKSMGGREAEYGNAPTSASTGGSQYYSPMAQSYDNHVVPPPAAYQSFGHHQQEETDDMDAAYGGYVVGNDEDDRGRAGAAVSGDGRRTSVLQNPFDGSGGRNDDGYSSGEDEPRRVLKVANE